MRFVVVWRTLRLVRAGMVMTCVSGMIERRGVSDIEHFALAERRPDVCQGGRENQRYDEREHADALPDRSPRHVFHAHASILSRMRSQNCLRGSKAPLGRSTMLQTSRYF